MIDLTGLNRPQHDFLISKIHAVNQGRLCQLINWSMATMLRNKVIVGRAQGHPRSTQLAMLTMKKEFHALLISAFTWFCSWKF